MDYMSNQWLEFIINNSLEGEPCTDRELEKIKQHVLDVVDVGVDAGFDGDELDGYHVFMLKHIIKLYYILVAKRNVL